MKSISIILGANSKLLKYLDHKVFVNTVYYYFLYNKNFPKSQKIFLENKFGGVDKRFFKSNFNWIPYLVQDLKQLRFLTAGTVGISINLVRQKPELISNLNYVTIFFSLQFV